MEAGIHAAAVFFGSSEMAHTALLLLLPVTSGFYALSRRPASPAAPIICHAAPRLACHATSLRLASTVETRPAIAPDNYAGIPGGPTGPPGMPA